MEKVTVVKVGGAIVEDSEQLAQLLKDFAAIPGKKVLVHGGGRRATKVAAALGIESKMVNGRRITDADMLEVVTMVYGGLVNKNLVAKLQANGVNALGLTGADMDVIHSHKRPLKDGIDFGFVGDVERANGKMLQTLINEGITPVMAPLTHDGKGNILNTNADTIASETAKALAPYYDVTLIYSFEKKGVLSNQVLIRGTFLEGLTLAIRGCAYFVQLRIAKVKQTTTNGIRQHLMGSSYQQPGKGFQGCRRRDSTSLYHPSRWTDRSSW